MERQRLRGDTPPDAHRTGRAPDESACDYPGCPEAGEYRAPRSREELGSYYRFCLAHAREYNASWNYCAGMDDRAIEAEMRQDTVWRRPTWPLGARVPGSGLRDPFGLFHRDESGNREQARARNAQLAAMSAAERNALAILGLDAPVSLDDVKLRYKLLAKTLHPDANGGDKRAEERLKSVNHAYTTLRHSDRLT
ncbi:MAG: J domain-containing protein [Rhodospirillaceae bacterium]